MEWRHFIVNNYLKTMIGPCYIMLSQVIWCNKVLSMKQIRSTDIQWCNYDFFYLENFSIRPPLLWTKSFLPFPEKGNKYQWTEKSLLLAKFASGGTLYPLPRCFITTYIGTLFCSFIIVYDKLISRINSVFARYIIFYFSISPWLIKH